MAQLLDVLAHGEQAVEAGFVARLDGDAHGYYFFFDSRLGARPAESLAAALSGRGVDVSVGVIADVRTLDGLVRDARAAEAGARRARERDTRDDATG